MNIFRQKLIRLFTLSFLSFFSLGILYPKFASAFDHSFTTKQNDNNQVEANYKEIYTPYQKGQELLKKSKYLDAIAAYEQALKLDPNFDKALAGKAWSLYFLKDYVKSFSFFEMAIAINPGSHEYWRGKGDSLYYLGRFEDSLEAYNTSLEFNDFSSYAWMGKCWALAKLQEFDSALEAVNRAIEINYDSSHSWAVKGWILNKSERYQEARTALKQSLQLDSNYNFARNQLLIAERGLGLID